MTAWMTRTGGTEDLQCQCPSQNIPLVLATATSVALSAVYDRLPAEKRGLEGTEKSCSKESASSSHFHQVYPISWQSTVGMNEDGRWAP